MIRNKIKEANWVGIRVENAVLKDAVKSYLKNEHSIESDFKLSADLIDDEYRMVINFVDEVRFDFDEHEFVAAIACKLGLSETEVDVWPDDYNGEYFRVEVPKSYIVDLK